MLADLAGSESSDVDDSATAKLAKKASSAVPNPLSLPANRDSVSSRLTASSRPRTPVSAPAYNVAVPAVVPAAAAASPKSPCQPRPGAVSAPGYVCVKKEDSPSDTVRVKTEPTFATTVGSSGSSCSGVSTNAVTVKREETAAEQPAGEEATLDIFQSTPMENEDEIPGLGDPKSSRVLPPRHHHRHTASASTPGSGSVPKLSSDSDDSIAPPASIVRFPFRTKCRSKRSTAGEADSESSSDPSDNDGSDDEEATAPAATTPTRKASCDKAAACTQEDSSSGELTDDSGSEVDAPMPAPAAASRSSSTASNHPSGGVSALPTTAADMPSSDGEITDSDDNNETYSAANRTAGTSSYNNSSSSGTAAKPAAASSSTTASGNTSPGVRYSRYCGISSTERPSYAPPSTKEIILPPIVKSPTTGRIRHLPYRDEVFPPVLSPSSSSDSDSGGGGRSPGALRRRTCWNGGSSSAVGASGTGAAANATAKSPWSVIAGRGANSIGGNDMPSASSSANPAAGGLSGSHSSQDYMHESSSHTHSRRSSPDHHRLQSRPMSQSDSSRPSPPLCKPPPPGSEQRKSRSRFDRSMSSDSSSRTSSVSPVQRSARTPMSLPIGPAADDDSVQQPKPILSDLHRFAEERFVPSSSSRKSSPPPSSSRRTSSPSVFTQPSPVVASAAAITTAAGTVTSGGVAVSPSISSTPAKPALAWEQPVADHDSPPLATGAAAGDNELPRKDPVSFVSATVFTSSAYQPQAMLYASTLATGASAALSDAPTTTPTLAAAAMVLPATTSAASSTGATPSPQQLASPGHSVSPALLSTTNTAGQSPKRSPLILPFKVTSRNRTLAGPKVHGASPVVDVATTGECEDGSGTNSASASCRAYADTPSAGGGGSALASTSLIAGYSEEESFQVDIPVSFPSLTNDGGASHRSVSTDDQRTRPQQLHLKSMAASAMASSSSQNRAANTTADQPGKRKYSASSSRSKQRHYSSGDSDYSLDSRRRKSDYSRSTMGSRGGGGGGYYSSDDDRRGSRHGDASQSSRRDSFHRDTAARSSSRRDGSGGGGGG
eukprot:scpid29422/ scgid1068/ 